MPGSRADWTAATKEDFESSIQALGDSLVARLGAEGIEGREGAVERMCWG